MKGIVRVVKRGRSVGVTLPKFVREELFVIPGDFMVCLVEDGTIRLVPIKADKLLEAVRNNEGGNGVRGQGSGS